LPCICADRRPLSHNINKRRDIVPTFYILNLQCPLWSFFTCSRTISSARRYSSASSISVSQEALRSCFAIRLLPDSAIILICVSGSGGSSLPLSIYLSILSSASSISLICTPPFDVIRCYYYIIIFDNCQYFIRDYSIIY